MILTIDPNNQLSKYVVYKVIQDNQIILVWRCKFTELLQMKDCIKNPAFNIHKICTIEIISWHDSINEASNKIHWLMSKEGQFYYNWPPLNKTLQVNNRQTMIRCNQTGEIFIKHADAVRKYNLNPSQLSQHLKKTDGFKTIKGMTFDYASFYGLDLKPVKLPAEKTDGYYKGTGKKIRCNETGQEFRTQGFACKWLGINPAQLSQHLRGVKGFKTVKNMTFSYVRNQPPLAYPIKYPQK